MNLRRTLVVGYDGPESGHARYCKTFVESLREQGETVEFHSQRAMPRGGIAGAPVLRQVDRTVRTVANALESIAAIRRAHPSVVHFQLVTPIIDQFWIPRVAAARPLVLTVHNVEPHERTIGMSPRAFGRILSATRAVIVHSHANKRRLAELYPDVLSRIAVIPHGVWRVGARWTKREACRVLNIDPARPTILFFGAIRRNKGLALLLEALPALANRLPSPPCVLIAGQPRENGGFKQYDSLIQRIGVRQYVEVRLGQVDEEDVPLYFGAADVVALPYEPTFQAQSGVLLDAYAYGVPVVATDAGGIAELVEEDSAGIVVRPRACEAFGEALGTILRRPELREDMSRRMLRLAAGKYSWTAVASMTQALYGRVSAGVVHPE